MGKSKFHAALEAAPTSVLVHRIEFEARVLRGYIRQGDHEGFTRRCDVQDKIIKAIQRQINKRGFALEAPLSKRYMRAQQQYHIARGYYDDLSKGKN